VRAGTYRTVGSFEWLAGYNEGMRDALHADGVWNITMPLLLYIRIRVCPISVTDIRMACTTREIV